MVFLWTDYFVYLLLGITLYLACHILGHARLRRKWRHVLYRPLNLIAFMILLAYIMIGALDSIHFAETSMEEKKSTTGIISLLDKMLSPLMQETERTYSAPFAIYSFTKESITLPNGEVVRDYPRLKYAGKQLSAPSEKFGDIFHRFIRTWIESSLIWIVLSILCIQMACIKHKLAFEDFVSSLLTGNTLFPWRTFLLCLWGGIFIPVFIYHFMGFYHILGTDQVGQDVLYMAMKSIRTGLIIGTLTTLVMLPFAVLFGIMAGYFRGWIDDVIQYVYTTLSSIPGVLLIAASVLALEILMERHADAFESVLIRSDLRLLALCIILGITSWTSLCRFMRAEALKISQMDYVHAALSLGVSHFKILFKHLLPNVLHIILITVVLDFSGLVLAEAVLSYVGVGVDPASYSWGIMINSARLEMARIPVVWWNLFAAFIFMFTLVLAANVFSDALRDTFDPHHRH